VCDNLKDPIAPTQIARGSGTTDPRPLRWRGDPNLDGVELTHVDAAGAARMVDVSHKPVTERTATARARFSTTAEVVALLRRDGLPKGDALAVARIAGIAAAKKTPDLVPLCHSLGLHAVQVDLDPGESWVDITATTRTADRTGVEMEAMTAVLVAGLTLYDMVKAVDRAATITDVRLVAKSGGKSGEWTRP
jgi:cyclic pyranopterin phosphate synthase